MAGSYRHIIRADGSFNGVELLDHLGDAYGALEECYDMIQHLTGGDRAKIHEAWREGHCMKRIPARVREAPQFYTYERYWEDM